MRLAAATLGLVLAAGVAGFGENDYSADGQTRALVEDAVDGGLEKRAGAKNTGAPHTLALCPLP